MCELSMSGDNLSIFNVIWSFLDPFCAEILHPSRVTMHKVRAENYIFYTKQNMLFPLKGY